MPTFQSTISVRRATRDIDGLDAFLEFQSTLSVRRATSKYGVTMTDAQKFQSTLSVRRATDSFRCVRKSLYISIHALRKESDNVANSNAALQRISIHALRKESDQVAVAFHAEREISIHALRKESDGRL